MVKRFLDAVETEVFLKRESLRKPHMFVRMNESAVKRLVEEAGGLVGFSCIKPGRVTRIDLGAYELTISRDNTMEDDTFDMKPYKVTGFYSCATKGGSVDFCDISEISYCSSMDCPNCVAAKIAGNLLMELELDLMFPKRGMYPLTVDECFSVEEKKNLPLHEVLDRYIEAVTLPGVVEMLKHVGHTALYRIDRPCLWFAKTDVLELEKLDEYYTREAIASLIKDGYIKAIRKDG